MTITHQTLIQLVALYPGITIKNLLKKVQETWPEINNKWFDKSLNTALEKDLIIEADKQLWLTDIGSKKIKKDPLLNIIRKRISDLEERVTKLEN